MTCEKPTPQGAELERSVARIVAKATSALGSPKAAEQWLERPAMGLRGRRPIELPATAAGVGLVEEFLNRLEYGVYV